MRTALAVCLLSLFAATTSQAANRLSDTCKGRIAYDLGQKGYDVRAIRVKGIDKGYCDNETCNSSVLELLISARDLNVSLVTLEVAASTPSEGAEGCRVYGARLAKKSL